MHKIICLTGSYDLVLQVGQASSAKQLCAIYTKKTNDLLEFPGIMYMSPTWSLVSGLDCRKVLLMGDVSEATLSWRSPIWRESYLKGVPCGGGPNWKKVLLKGDLCEATLSWRESHLEGVLLEGSSLWRESPLEGGSPEGRSVRSDSQLEGVRFKGVLPERCPLWKGSDWRKVVLMGDLPKATLS